MNDNEDLKNKLVFSISSEFNLKFEDQQIVNELISTMLLKYEVNKKSTELVATDVSEKVVMYLQAMKLQGIKDNTLQNYFYFLRKFVGQMNKRVADININDLRMFLVKECEGQKNSTINVKTTYIQNFFSWMFEEDIIGKNPAKKLSHVSMPERLRSPLSIEEIEKLRIACTNDRERVILEVLFATGCRISEMVKIDVSDLDFRDNCVHTIGKGDKERILLFNDKTKVYIERYLESRKDNSKALITSIKKPYNRLGTKGVRYVIKKIAKRANFDKSIYPHLFRHTMATIGLSNGASIVTVQKLLGHKSLETTQKYAETSIEKVRYEYNHSLTV